MYSGSAQEKLPDGPDLANLGISQYRVNAAGVR